MSVFEPGFVPGTGLSREQGPVARAMLRALQPFPGMASPSRSAPVRVRIQPPLVASRSVTEPPSPYG